MNVIKNNAEELVKFIEKYEELVSKRKEERDVSEIRKIDVSIEEVKGSISDLNVGIRESLRDIK